MRSALLWSLWVCGTAAADVPVAYQQPSADLVQLADAALPPAVLPGPNDETVLLADTPPLLPIAEVAQTELKLGGLRFNPENHAETRAVYFSALRFLDTATGQARPVTGIPAGGRVRQPEWSPDGRLVALTVAFPTRVELWVAERATGKARRVSNRPLNAAFPSPACQWLSDSRSLACRTLPAQRTPPPTRRAVPAGPLVEENLGTKTPAPTFQDLLHDEDDAALFEYHLNAEAWILRLDGTGRKVVGPALIVTVAPSPDATVLLVKSLRRPFSYHVSAERFPLRSEVIGMDGKSVAVIADLPLADQVPIDFDAVRTGRREIEWRADSPAELSWVEARDGGDPKAEVPVRDELYTLAAPFTQLPTRLAALGYRFFDVLWGNGHVAVLRERWWKTRQEREWRLAPDAPGMAPKKMSDRSYEDRYADPGDLQTRLSARGTAVLWMDPADGHAFRFGTGGSPDGDRPFVDALDLDTLQTTRRWRSEAPRFERPLALFGDGQHVLSRRESQTEPPDLVLRDLSGGEPRALTTTPHPYPSLVGSKRELIRYHRADGLALSATLYVPPGYDGKQRLPVLMWAYPAEFKAAQAAGQVRDSPYRFPRLFWGSPLYWLAHGYAVVDNPTFPIVGEGNVQPNDSYVRQLVQDAQAAVDEVVRRGVADRDRIAIGGHSYGAFTTANLLAHSRLYRAGIARSGAYNRTLTPFGFQSEERNFWEASSTYVDMSPFAHAADIQDPLLLIHGTEDNNQGTFPMQSERLFAALKGLGKTARLAMLPHEAHAYRARESVLHMLWEMDRWLDTYVKNAPARATTSRASP
jgi:dipeptidyl aminopeptidase/acylaminoacyl peptidase